MTRLEIEQTVNQFLLEELEIDEALIKSSSRLKEDLRIDSLDFVDIAVLVEEHFGFKIKIEEFKKVLTLEDFYTYIEQRMK